MKKTGLILISLFVLLLTSCGEMYPNRINSGDYICLDDYSYIYNKTTIKTFEHLKDPLVITMPVMETRYYKGKRNNKTYDFYNGDIFIVIDVETDKLYDWIYYGSETSWTDNHLIGLGKDSKKYYTRSAKTKKVTCLDPTKTEVKQIDVELNGMASSWFRSWGVNSEYALLENFEYDYEKDIHYEDVRILDSKTDTFSDIIKIPLDNMMTDRGFRTDNNENIWFSSERDDKCLLFKIDCKNKEYKEYDLQTKYAINEDEGKFVTYSVEYIDNNKVYLVKDNEINNLEINLYEIQDDKAIKIAENTNTGFKSGEQYLFNIVNINNKLYAITKNCAYNERAYVEIYEMDKDTLELTKLEQDENDRFAITFTPYKVWVKGSRIYLANQDNSTEFFCKWYDVENNTYDNVGKYISFEDVVSTAK